jgi:glyoxylase-like metal-dependent hydrolase (beta-lactamase superfamily II)
MTPSSRPLGDLRLTLVLDAIIEIDGNQVFFPASQMHWGEGLTVGPHGILHVPVNALLVSAGDQHTLIDTGFGEEEHPDRAESVLKSLAELGVPPKAIQRVILTHAHGDHVLGNTLRRAGQWLPTFPLAEYVIQEREIAAARAERSALWTTRFQPLAERGQLRLIDGRTELSEALVCWPTPGHTIGHQSVLLRSKGAQALFMGDLAVLAKNMEHLEWGHSWAWSLDVDRQSRREVAEWAIAEDATLIIGHDAQHPWVKIVRAGEGYRTVPVA